MAVGSREYKLMRELVSCGLCGFCLAHCPTFEVLKNEAFSPRGRMIYTDLLLKEIIPVEKEILDAVFSCTNCQTCQYTCPTSVKVSELIIYLREQLSKKGAPIPQKFKEIVMELSEKGRLFSYPPDNIVKKGNPKSERLLFAGCVASSQLSNLLEITTKIMSTVGLDFKVFADENCCGGFLKILGLREEFKKLAQKNVEKFEEEGIEEVITICPLCAETLKQDYAEVTSKSINIKHVVQVLCELLDNGKLKFANSIPIKCVYHDPCHLGRHMEIYDEPRKILEAIPGLKLMEIEDMSKELSFCCGGPIREPFRDLAWKMSEKICEEAKKIGANTIVTTCPTCNRNISFNALQHEIKVQDILEIVAKALNI
ncbi:MAG: (Fe-S)-binding protein [Candidatus Baldrarchaeia archaeon]